MEKHEITIKFSYLVTEEEATKIHKIIQEYQHTLEKILMEEIQYYISVQEHKKTK